MMAQYLEIKAAHPDALLFYRMGDFYEMFFDDAVAASQALDITLTRRGKHDNGEIPMCGVPHHAAEGYFLTLIRKGFRVAICEQMESPAEARKRGHKSVVRREVVRLVTPGTLTEDALLSARSHNFLAAYAAVRDQGALAWADISTGDLHVLGTGPGRLGPELARLAPAELVVNDALAQENLAVFADLGIPTAPLGASAFDSAGAEKRLLQIFQVRSLDAFGSFSRAEIAALGALVAYLEITQKGKLPLLKPPRRETADRVVRIDAATRRNLELTRGADGGRAGSLLSVIDRSATAGGARLLEQRLSSPLRDAETITHRLDAIGFAMDRPQLAVDAVAALKRAPDLERALSRLSLDRAGPRDLAAVRNALAQGALIHDLLTAADPPRILADAARDLTGQDDLVDLLDNALVADPPLAVRDGGFIAAGHDSDLDNARHLRDEGRGVIAGLQRRYAEDTGIGGLRIKHNNVLGYFIETTATHAEKMLSPPLSERFIHRQTTANQVRFSTVELSDLETRILNAGNLAQDREKALYEDLRARVMVRAGPVAAAARALAEIDLTFALADLARGEDWCRPKVDGSRAFLVENGRHPVVEDAMRRQSGDPFIANTCDLSATDSAAIWLLTGPNMAGKSTFLRQNALIAILAQIGSYVPASNAHIGLVSQIFSRVGASDDLARGRSTFMVEMVETAAILNQADDRALVILDEIGRGTATYDGLSIAWATLEHLHAVNRSRALFATHYHELTGLAAKLEGVENATVSVKEWQGEVIFLHEVRKGAADRSYGVQVAQLAGLPKSVVDRARSVLQQLEAGDRDATARRPRVIDDLPLFSAAAAAPAPAASPLRDMLAEVQPDDLTAREALDLVYRLKAALEA
ncbi:MAG: DNA mismatch repair protein MutS [Rhodobacteraceae bacterium]|nr:DNA mismatch repair protein MutS [Paracoccaceae bacterium]